MKTATKKPIKKPKTPYKKFKTEEARENYMYKQLTFTKKKKTYKIKL